ncbi:DUF5682 family protein [Rapidithrix thailandica]|uniref:DUF5682 family protein n=1 Tax=Rapidithrix thailandica TaxID=413964 RepID=A0AAW9RYK7_9BACT
MAVHLLGIRHHGPGSARNVAAYLEELQPDIILVEGPPEAESLLEWVAHEEMKPPVALLAYLPDTPQQAVFYPFAEFSPEWQAIQYGLRKEVPVKFCDLPLANSFALQKEPPADEATSTEDNTEGQKEEASVAEGTFPEVARDPFSYLAEAAGHSDGEKWWERNFESRKDNSEIFEAVQEAVTALREAFPNKDNQREQLREAWMRKVIRTAQREKYENIVVICGAWHVPALADMPKQKEDNALLKGLTKEKVQTTWIPWTYDRLAYQSGYGAGVLSPGWYEHLWKHPHDDGTLWMSKIAQLLRSKDMDTSVAHIIETVRLANSLAALRNQSQASLEEFNEAVTTVIGFGDDVLLQLIREELIVSNRLGEVPSEVPKVPLLIDVERMQKSYRLKPTTGIKQLKLDLRKENDLAKSIFLHRLNLLGIPYGLISRNSGKGTFKEEWNLLWEPEFVVQLIEKGIWGNTLLEATTKYLSHKASEVQSASELISLLEQSIPSDLPDSVGSMVRKLDSLAATTTDITELMKSIPGLANVLRYGSVRNTDFTALKTMFDSIVTRVCIGVPMACVNIDHDAAGKLLEFLEEIDHALSLVQEEELDERWQSALLKIQGSHQSNALVAGYATRLLMDKTVMEYPEVEKQLSYYLSVTNAPIEAAYWFEGFLRSSGTILLLDDKLWELMHNWVASIPEDSFIELLPVLRRTFAEFTPAERTKIGAKAKGTGTRTNMPVAATRDEDLNSGQARKILPVIEKLLGVSAE